MLNILMKNHDAEKNDLCQKYSFVKLAIFVQLLINRSGMQIDSTFTEKSTYHTAYDEELLYFVYTDVDYVHKNFDAKKTNHLNFAFLYPATQ